MCERVEKTVKGSSCCINKGSVSTAILGFLSLMVMKGISTSTLSRWVWRSIIKHFCSDNSVACQKSRLISHCVYCPSSWLLWIHWAGSLCKKMEQVKALTTDSIFSISFSTWKIQHYYLLPVARKYLFLYGQTWLVTSDMLSRKRDLQKPVGKEMEKFGPLQEFVQELWSVVRLKVRQLQSWCAKHAPWWKKKHQWSQEDIRR